MEIVLPPRARAAAPGEVPPIPPLLPAPPPPPPPHPPPLPPPHDGAGAPPARGAIALDRTPLRTRLEALGPLAILLVPRRSDAERLFDGLLAAHHYLGYARPVGEQLKYLVFAGERPLAGLAWGSAPRHLGPRDRFIGWSPAARRRNLRYLAYNTRFLILPWVEVPHLASHLLGRIARRVA